MKWLILSSALFFETTGFVALKHSAGFTKLAPSLAAVALDLCALALFVLALRRFETGFVYTVAAGIGTALIALANRAFFRAPFGFAQVVFILLIVAGTVGLQRTTPH